MSEQRSSREIIERWGVNLIRSYVGDNLRDDFIVDVVQVLKDLDSYYARKLAKPQLPSREELKKLIIESDLYQSVFNLGGVDYADLPGKLADKLLEGWGKWKE